MSDQPVTRPDDADERLRRIALIIRQGLYFVADELGKEFGLERPCKRCEAERRRPRQTTEEPKRAA